MNNILHWIIGQLVANWGAITAALLALLLAFDTKIAASKSGNSFLKELFIRG